MEAINPGLAVFLTIVATSLSAAFGVYSRYRLRNSIFIRSDNSIYMGLATLITALALLFAFAACQLYGPMFAAFLLTCAVLAGLIWGANPTWEE
jgi:hypothetical protein